MIPPRQSSRPTTRNARGFTLIEVVLALALSVLLLGAIFGALDQSWRLTASGRDEMQRMQLGRALLSLIAKDIRSIAFTPPPPTEDSASSSSSTSSSSSSSSGGSSSSGSSGASSSGSSSSGSSSNSSSSSTSSSSTPPVSLTSIGIQGDAQRIEMHITRPRRDLDFTPGVDGSKMHTHISDLVAVQYHLATGGTGMSGLVRTEADRLAVLSIESKNQAADSVFKQQLLAHEVAFLQFRYFDGVKWYPSWQSGPPISPMPQTNTSGSSSSSGTTSGSSSSGSSSSGSSGSTSSGSSSSSSSSNNSTTGTSMTMATTTTGMGRLPRAIEVTIGLAPPNTRLGPMLRTGLSTPTNVFRSVILLPISDPLPAEYKQ